MLDDVPRIDVLRPQGGDPAWVGVWRWDSAASLRAARQTLPGTTAATEAFAVAREVTAEDIEVLDEL
ncbi:hypothetical protein [Nonomuraea guangzhouensis]|uniref:ABM domain-containing protein n=1 Tax=Nonomuraea guangzhouensis TaxID=1291555 RepID=A0ABW4GN65_9ACTN|nr:hypothetical protein [Nonomuraea guangzhouensis]